MAVTYGWIAGSVIRHIADTETAPDRTPADRPSAGEVIITPLVASTAGGHLVARGQDRRTLDADGYIVDLDGAPGVAVPVGAYRIEWALTGGYRWPAQDITVTAEHTKDAPYDIGEQAPVQPPPGTPMTVLEVPSGAFDGAAVGWDGDGLAWLPGGAAAAASAAAALASEQAAETAESGAVTAQGLAEDARDAAAGSAVAAGESAGLAAGSASGAVASATTASDAATSATGSASAASSSASSASGSAATATGAASSASGSASAAAGSASAAATSAGQAASSATAASGSATAASGSASAASTSATDADADRVAAAASASAAAASAAALAGLLEVGPGDPRTPDTTSGQITGSEPNGCMYRSTDGGGVGGYLWTKRGGVWVCEIGDTGWINLNAKLDTTKWSLAAGALAGLFVRRIANTVLLTGRLVRAAGAPADMLGSPQRFTPVGTPLLPDARFQPTSQYAPSRGIVLVNYGAFVAGISFEGALNNPEMRVASAGTGTYTAGTPVSFNTEHSTFTDWPTTLTL